MMDNQFINGNRVVIILSIFRNNKMQFTLTRLDNLLIFTDNIFVHLKRLHNECNKKIMINKTSCLHDKTKLIYIYCVITKLEIIKYFKRNVMNIKLTYYLCTIIFCVMFIMINMKKNKKYINEISLTCATIRLILRMQIRL
ncbi:hypothetical protein RFI_08939 [Reticulomyxa filosa]|uniref:Uncharacterized protein n=1 Tax=Reticulomyxa filosa TaxID=46433 RepID=X6NQJ8_RETFI|nr:hypothetical protein RFI_08939 [Reticulomyxa filosa]|eukprot:ETO28193.1 hypothetical protein RFI_08939 [Reticulomyxa filosa]